MRKDLIIFILTVTLLGMQACVTRREITASRRVPTASPSESTLAEKKEKIETQRMAYAERRRIEFEEHYKTIPYYTNADGSVVYNKAELEPVYNGGEQALNEYLRNNLVYPGEAEKQGLEGTVFVDFVVQSNGTIAEVVVLDVPGELAINQSLQDEAVRVILNMPNWIPGRQHGEAVDVRYSLPITFRIC